MTTTVSKLVAQNHTEQERALLRRWCEEAAKAGGSFGITAVYDLQFGHCITYTIDWPDGPPDDFKEARRVVAK